MSRFHQWCGSLSPPSLYLAPTPHPRPPSSLSLPGANCFPLLLFLISQRTPPLTIGDHSRLAENRVTWLLCPL